MTTTSHHAGRRSQRKGARAEKNLAHVLSEITGIPCHKASSMYLPGFLAPDVAGVPGVHFEAKACLRFALPQWLEQARRDAAVNGEVGVVCFKPRRNRWLVVMDLADLPDLANRINNARKGTRNEGRT
jgi:hypothetical protein